MRLPGRTLTLREDKAALRRDALRRRSEIGAGAASAAALKLCDNFFSTIVLGAVETVSGYWPIKDELNVRPLMAGLHDRGHAIALPTVSARGAPLIFRAWRPGSALEAGVLGTSVPPPSAQELIPDALLVPALAVDHAGFRLGYGGGYYDRTLAHLRDAERVDRRSLAIGICFECQRVAKVPHDESDERLDWIVTESGAERVT